jgi:hypothetical protein
MFGIAMPVDVTGAATFSQYIPYRFNADRRIVHGTDQPWLYSNGYRDLRRIDCSLTYFDPTHESPVLPSGKPPVLDGKLDDACWAGGHAVQLPHKNALVLLRHDKDHLYIAYERRHASESGALPITSEESYREPKNGEAVEHSMQIYLGNAKFTRSLDFDGSLYHLAVSADGAASSGILKNEKAKKEDPWQADWKHAALKSGETFVIEAAIPWTTLEKQGLKRNNLVVNYLLEYSKDICETNHKVFIFEEELPARTFTARLHFAEIDNAKPGERIFDVVIQGKTVLKDFDIRKEAGAADTALVKEIKGITATRNVVVEFIPHGDASKPKSQPLLSAIEIIDEHPPKQGTK